MIKKVAPKMPTRNFLARLSQFKTGAGSHSKSNKALRRAVKTDKRSFFE